MHRLRELIYPTYFLQLISIIAQKSQIPRECRAVAAYVDDTFWLHLEDGLEQHFIAAFAWRVDYDHVCVDTPFFSYSLGRTSSAFPTKNSTFSILLICAFRFASSIAAGTISTPRTNLAC